MNFVGFSILMPFINNLYLLHLVVIPDPGGHPFSVVTVSPSYFYQTGSAWSMDQGSTKNHSPVNNFAPTVTKFCVMWEGQALPHDTKFRICRGKIVDSRTFPNWSLIHGSSWSGLIKVGPAGWGSRDREQPSLGGLSTPDLVRPFYSLSGRASYRKISWSLEAMRSGLDFSNRSENWQAPRQTCQSRLRDFTRSCGKTSA